MISKERRNELLDKVLDFNQQFREATRDMTNEERVFFLETQVMAFNKVIEVFKKGDPESK